MSRLSDLRPGATTRLLSVGGERSFRRRLMELGLLPGTQLQVVRCGGPAGLVEVIARDCRLTIRKSEALLLLVSES